MSDEPYNDEDDGFIEALMAHLANPCSEEKVIKHPNLSEVYKRSLNYTITDNRMFREIDAFIQKNSYSEKGKTREEVEGRLQKTARFIIDWLDTNEVEDLPESYAVTEVFPVLNVGIVGIAGSGKSFSAINYHRRNPDICITGPINKVTRQYVSAFNKSTLPNGLSHQKTTNTWHKLLSLGYAQSTTRAVYEKIVDNPVMKAEYTRYVEESSMFCGDPNLMRDMTRRLTKKTLRTVHKLACTMLDRLKKQFLNGHYRFRNCIIDTSSPYYQSPQQTFAWVTDVQNVLMDEETLPAFASNALSWIRDEPEEERQKRKTMLENITSQEQYKRYVFWVSYPSGFDGKMQMPSPMTIYPVVMSEEDGKTSAFMKLLATIFQQMIVMIYNPPYAHERPFVYFTSGSETQCGAIDSQVSALGLVRSPIVMHDVNNTMVWQSKFFRRDINNFNTIDAKLHRLWCTCLEANLLPESLHTSTLTFREDFSQHAADPGHCPKGPRLFITHHNVDQYNTIMQERGDEQIALSDYVFISSNVIDINENKRNVIKDISQDELSELSPFEAEKNRQHLWLRKLELYQSDGARVVNDNNIKAKTKKFRKLHTIVPFGQSVDNTTRGVFVSETYPYNEEHDIQVTDALEKVKKRLYSQQRKRQNDRMKRKCTDLDGANSNSKVNPTYYDYPNTDACDEKESHEESDDDGKIENENENENNNEDDEIDVEGNHIMTGDAYMEGQGRHKAAYRQDHNRIKKTIDNSKKNVDKMGPQLGRSEGKDSELISKVYIKGPAKLLLSKEEHLSHRVYVNHIAEALGKGKEYASNVFNSSNAIDQTAPFVYDPSSDMVTFYAIPDMIAFAEKKRQVVCESIKHRLTGMEVHLGFKRERVFANNTRVLNIGQNTSVVLRGTHSTLQELLKDPILNGNTTPVQFKCLIFLEAIAEFRRWYINRFLVSKGRALTNFHDAESENKICEAWLLAAFSSNPEKTEDLELIETFTIQSKDVIENGNVGLGLPDDLLRSLMGQLAGLQRRHGEFFTEQKLELYAHRSPFFKALSYSAMRPVPLDSLNATNTPLCVIGNYMHECMADEMLDLQSRIPKNTNTKFLPSDYRDEQRIDQTKLMKSEAMMCTWALKTWKPSLLYKTTAVLQINDNVIVSTRPGASSNSSLLWNKLFAGKDNIGYMMRENQMDLSIPESCSYHQMFLLPEGESTSFPRPFVAGGGPPKSGIVVKTQTGNPIPFAADDNENRFFMKNKFYKVESSAVVGLPCPIMVNSAYTYHFAQGTTVQGKLFMDLGKLVDPRKRQLILPAEDILSAVLVGASRADQAENTRTANVDKGIAALGQSSEIMSEQLTSRLAKKRKLCQASLPFEFLR